mgnify:CR=1 FL=1
MDVFDTDGHEQVVFCQDPASGLQRQSLSWSLDRGRTWTPYDANPVLDVGSTAFRDPKVFRHDDAWWMVLVLADDRTVELYRSADLIAWEHVSSFCPEGAVEGLAGDPDAGRGPDVHVAEHRVVRAAAMCSSCV